MDISEIFNLLFFWPVFILFILFFIIVVVKKILFWLYLWQLKEYHIGRFLAHFSTAKGKELLLNKLNYLKLFILFFFIFIYPRIISHRYSLDPPTFDNTLMNLFISPQEVLILIYVMECLKAVKDFFQRRIRSPIFTEKILFLFSLIVITTLIFFYLIVQRTLDTFSAVVISDLVIPLTVSLIVLLFQPLTVLGRNRIINKAKKKREQFKNLLVVGITGSYGKTSTKEFLATILEEKFPGKVLKTKEHQNSEIGISQCILNDLKEEHKIFVCEMGAYNRGGIKLLCDIVKPKISILTGINEQHMATFGSLENIIKTKYELIESLPEDGLAFFNGRNKYCLELYKKTKIKKFLYEQEVKSADMENIEGAKAVARELGLSEDEILRGSSKIKNKFPGLEIKKGIKGLNIIDATYSANPDGVISHLEYLKNWQGKKILVMPCLIELGGASAKVHKRIGRKIGEVCDLAIITTKDKFKEIREGAGDKALFLENPKEIYEKIIGFSKPNDVVLLESRVPDNLTKKLLNENI